MAQTENSDSIKTQELKEIVVEARDQRLISANDNITDLAGKSIDVFIDFLPASQNDLHGIRMQDVKKVE